MEAVGKLQVQSKVHRTRPLALAQSFVTQANRPRIWFRTANGWASRPRTQIDKARNKKVFARLTS